MGYIGKLTAQEAERLLELIEKLQQKGDASGDEIDFITNGTGNAFLSNDGTYKEIESGGDVIILSQYNLDVGQTTDKNKELYNTLYDSHNDIPVYWQDDLGDAHTYSLIPCAINYVNNSNEDYFKITQLNMGYSESQDNEGKPKGVFLVMGVCYRVHSNGYCDRGEGIDNRNFEENLNKFIGLTLPFEGAVGNGTKFLADDYTYKEINASSIYAINTEEDLNYNKIKEALDNGKLISIPMMGLSICNTFIDEDNNINILMDKIPTEASFFLNLSKATYIKISPNNEITFTSDGEEPLFNAMTINIPFVFKDINNRINTIITNDDTD